MVRLLASPALVRLPPPLLVPVVVASPLLLLSASSELAPVPGSPLGLADQDQQEGEEEEGEEEPHDGLRYESGLRLYESHQTWGKTLSIINHGLHFIPAMKYDRG